MWGQSQGSRRPQAGRCRLGRWALPVLLALCLCAGGILRKLRALVSESAPAHTPKVSCMLYVRCKGRGCALPEDPKGDSCRPAGVLQCFGSVGSLPWHGFPGGARDLFGGPWGAPADFQLLLLPLIHAPAFVSPAGLLSRLACGCHW